MVMTMLKVGKIPRDHVSDDRILAIGMLGSSTVEKEHQLVNA